MASGRSSPSSRFGLFLFGLGALGIAASCTAREGGHPRQRDKGRPGDTARTDLAHQGLSKGAAGVGRRSTGNPMATTRARRSGRLPTVTNETPLVTSTTAVQEHLGTNEQVWVVGTLEQVPKGREPEARQAMALVLDDCSLVVLSHGHAPRDFEDQLGRRVCVAGRLERTHPGQGQSPVAALLVAVGTVRDASACQGRLGPSETRRRRANGPARAYFTALRGTFVSSKCCPAILVPGRGLVLMPDLDPARIHPGSQRPSSLSQLQGKMVQALGWLGREKYWPNPGRNTTGEVRQGALGFQWVLRRACIRLVSARRASTTKKRRGPDRARWIDWNHAPGL